MAITIQSSLPLLMYVLNHNTFLKTLPQSNNSWKLKKLCSCHSKDSSDKAKRQEFVQPLNNFIIGDDMCLESTSSETQSFGLKAEPIIYSDANMTLSFLLEITFKTLGKQALFLFYLTIII